MATSIDYVQPLSFQQNTPFLTGLQAGTNLFGGMLGNQLKALQNQAAATQNQYIAPSLQQQLLSQSLANQRSQATLPYAAPQAAAQVGLTGAQTGLADAEANLFNQKGQYFPLTMLDPVSRMLYSRNYILPQLTSSNGGWTVAAANSRGMPSQQVATSTQSLPANATGISNMQVLPNALTAQQAQSKFAQLEPGPLPNTGNPNIDALYQNQYRNMMLQYGKNPAFGSAKSGEGGTYYDPTTGQYISSPTSANTTMAQRNITALQRSQPILNQLQQNLGQFQTLGGKARLIGEQIGNFLTGANLPLPAQYAQGQQALQTAPESLLRAWGLNVTNEALQRMQEAVEPHFGESQKQYNQRITNTLGDLQQMQQQSQQQLAQGIPLNSPLGSADQSAGAMSNSVNAMKIVNGKTYQKINGQWYEQ